MAAWVTRAHAPAAGPRVRLPRADIAARGLCVPLYPRMTDAEATQVAEALAALTRAEAA